MADLDPCITFQVNLITQEVLSHLSPDRYQTSQNQAIDDINARSNSRSTWLPWATFGGRVLQHGEKFTVCGREAIRIRDTYVNVENPSLVICDPDPEFNCVPDFGAEAEAFATATTTMIPVGTPATVTGGVGYKPPDELTVVGGTSTETAVVRVSSVKTILGQDEVDYTASEDNGSFTGGSGYTASDTITMSDGTVVLVDAVSTGAVTEFTITTISSTPHTSHGDTITQSFTSGEGATGFTMTLDILNQQVFAATYKQVSEINLGNYTVLPDDPVATIGGVSPAGATFNLDWGVRTVTVTNGGNGYEEAPAVSFSGSGGSGTTAVAALTGDAVSSITVTAAGSGYNERATVSIASP